MSWTRSGDVRVVRNDNCTVSLYRKQMLMNWHTEPNENKSRHSPDVNHSACVCVCVCSKQDVGSYTHIHTHTHMTANAHEDWFVPRFDPFLCPQVRLWSAGPPGWSSCCWTDLSARVARCWNTRSTAWSWPSATPWWTPSSTRVATRTWGTRLSVSCVSCVGGAESRRSSRVPSTRTLWTQTGCWRRTTRTATTTITTTESARLPERPLVKRTVKLHTCRSPYVPERYTR